MITIISVLLSLPKKPGLPEGTSIAQGPPNTGGKGVKKGEKTGFCIHKYSFPRNKPFIKVPASRLLSKHKG